MTTTTKNPSIDALDLRPALELRQESLQLIERMSAGEYTPELVKRAEELIEQESVIVDSFVESVRTFGGHPDGVRFEDGAYEVVNPLATGWLGSWLDWIKARPPVA